MRPYSPGGLLKRPLRKPRLKGHNLQVDIVYGVDYQVYLTCLLPTLSRTLSVSLCPGAAFLPVFLQISTHFTATPGIPPLQSLKPPVSNAVPRLSLGFHIRLDRPPACALRPVIRLTLAPSVTAAAGTELAGASSAGNVNCCGF